MEKMSESRGLGVDGPSTSTTTSSGGQKRQLISSRKSALALVQTNQVKAWLEELYSDVTFEIGLSDTIGDQVLDKHLAELGTTVASGLFTKSLEIELLAGRSHFAVHSLKDMPTNLPPGLTLAAICKRESPEDAVIIHPKHKEKGIMTLQALPDGAVIGTSSLRREALLRRMNTSFNIKTIRGNIQTRLKKLDEAEEYDAIVVAAAGFRRGGLGDRIDEVLPCETFGYGVGQGSIGIECRSDDHETLAMLQKVEHEESAQLCKAERSLLYHLEGGCQIAMGVNSTLDGDILTLYATLLSQDGQQCISEELQGSRFEAEEIGKDLAHKILSNPLSAELLGPRGEKRAITYGSAEAPGAAAAEASAAKRLKEESS